MKLQMKIQNIICYIVLTICSINFIFALGITTDIYNLMYVYDYGVQGADLYYNIQPFNDMLVRACIILIVSTIFLFITKTNNRRKYYISNYISTIVSVVVNIAISIWAIINISGYKTYFLTEVDFDMYKFWSEKFANLKYTESTIYFDISTTTFFATIIISFLLLGNLIWKTMLMKKEEKLLNNNDNKEETL